MPFEVLLAVLAAALVHAGWNAALKKASDPLVGSAGLAAGTVVVAVLILPWLPLPRPAAWPWIAGSIVVHLAYFTLLTLAYARGDLAPAYTVLRGLPPLLVATVSAGLVGEPLPGLAKAGVGLLSGGIVLLGLQPGTDKKSLLFAAMGAVTIATYTIVDGQGARASGHAASYVLWHGLGQSTLFCLGATAVRGRGLWQGIRQDAWRGLLGGAASIGGYGVVLWAMTRAPIALVSALRETSVVFAALLGALWLREPLGKRRLVAVGLVTAGAILAQLGRS